jgi:RNA polymerase sigma factor (sigma-70 family)
MVVTKKIEEKMWAYARTTARLFGERFSLSQREDIEDMVSAALCNMVKALREYDPSKSSFDTFLINHARYGALDWIRGYGKTRMRKKYAERKDLLPPIPFSQLNLVSLEGDDSSASELLDAVIGPCDGGYDKVDFEIDYQTVKEKIQLTPRERQVVEILEEDPYLTFQQIGDMMGVSPSRVWQLVRAIREKAKAVSEINNEEGVDYGKTEEASYPIGAELG